MDAVKTVDERKKDLTEAFRKGKIDSDAFLREMKALTKQPIELDVGPKGWLLIRFEGFRFPCNLAYEPAVELFSEENVSRVREFLKVNKSRFKIKD